MSICPICQAPSCLALSWSRSCAAAEIRETLKEHIAVLDPMQANIADVYNSGTTCPITPIIPFTAEAHPAAPVSLSSEPCRS